MFSPKKIDSATLLLIANMELGNKILDLGCGYGPIGICAARLKPDSEVTMVEINERAANLAKKNIRSNKITNARVMESDFFEDVSEDFDTILMNPPISGGLAKIYSAFEQSKEHLLPGGSLQVVARHNKGGARLEAWMGEIFGNVETLVKSGGFRVYKSVKS